MKIAITSDIYYPMINGVAVFAHNLANGLAKAGHQVLVICPSFNGNYHTEIDKETGVKTVYLTSARFPFYPDQINTVPDQREIFGHKMPRLAYKNGIWWSRKPWSEIEVALDEFKPDVIHLQTAETVALATLSYVRKNNVPLVSTGHAYPDNITSQFRIFKPKLVKKSVDMALRAYMASFLKHAEYATMPTEMAIEDLVPKNRKRFKVTVEALSNGINLTAFKPGKPNPSVLKKYNIKPNKHRFIYVGRVDPEKSICHVVDAFAKVAKKLPSADLLIVGDGVDKQNLVERAEALGLSDKIQFAGKITPPDLIEIYRSGAIFVTASETETQGIVLIEAAAVGLPIIAVNAGAVSALCQHRKNGLLCKPKDVSGIARAMTKLISDPKLQAQYSQQSIEIAKTHDLTRTLQRFEEIYQTAIHLKKTTNTPEA